MQSSVKPQFHSIVTSKAAEHRPSAMATVSLLRFSPKTLTFPQLRPIPSLPCLKSPKFSMSSRPTVPATDRLISALSYTLPFVNALQYGRFVFARSALARAAVDPLLPLLSLYHSIPLATFIAFFALYLGVVRNPAFDRFVRFNAMQAVVLDVFLAVPVLLQRVVGVPTRGVGLRVLEFGYNGIFAFAVFCFVYSVVNCVLGRTPYLPIVASAAGRQLE